MRGMGPLFSLDQPHRPAPHTGSSSQGWTSPCVWSCYGMHTAWSVCVWGQSVGPIWTGSGTNMQGWSGRALYAVCGQHGLPVLYAVCMLSLASVCFMQQVPALVRGSHCMLREGLEWGVHAACGACTGPALFADSSMQEQFVGHDRSWSWSSVQSWSSMGSACWTGPLCLVQHPWGWVQPHTLHEVQTILPAVQSWIQCAPHGMRGHSETCRLYYRSP